MRPGEMGEGGIGWYEIFYQGTGKWSLKNNINNNIAHTRKATDWPRSMDREKELRVAHTEFCLPKEIQT